MFLWHIVLGNFRKSSSILCLKPFNVVVWPTLVALSYGLAIYRNTFHSNFERRMFLQRLIWFLCFSELCLNYRWWVLDLFFYRWGWFVKLICASMNSYPFALGGQKYHNVILLFGNLLDSTEHEDSSWFCMANHDMPFSFLWPLHILNALFFDLLPFLSLKVIHPHIVKYDIRVCPSKYIQLIINNTATEISSRSRFYRRFYFNFRHCDLVILKIC